MISWGQTRGLVLEKGELVWVSDLRKLLRHVLQCSQLNRNIIFFSCVLKATNYAQAFWFSELICPQKTIFKYQIKTLLSYGYHKSRKESALCSLGQYPHSFLFRHQFSCSRSSLTLYLQHHYCSQCTLLSPFPTLLFLRSILILCPLFPVPSKCFKQKVKPKVHKCKSILEPTLWK